MHALHAIEKEIQPDVKAYAASVGREKERVTVQREVMAARVAAVFNSEHDLSKQFMGLVEIHAAPRWLWPALVEKMVAARYAIELEREADERRLANLKQGNEVPMVSIDTIGEFAKSREIAAEKFNESPATVARAVKIVKEGAPELVKAVERGDVSVAAAADVASLSPEEQAEIVADRAGNVP